MNDTLRTATLRLARAIGYDKSHITRTVAYRAV